MTALPFSIFYHPPLALAIAPKAIDKISVSEIPWLKLNRGYCSALRVLTDKAPFALLFILISHHICMVSALSFVGCARVEEFNCTAACYVSYSEH